MFNSANKFDFVDIKKVLPQYDQQNLFAKYTGIYPELNKGFYSLFRTDRKPGCRFVWHSGILYFVENAGFRGRLYFNIVDTICIIKNLDFKAAINEIIKGNTISGVSWDKINNENSKSNEKPDIRFKYKEWEKSNYFGLKPYDLYNENVYLVTDYWIGRGGDFKHNSIHNPKQTLTIAYHFPDSNNVKLYFPEKTEFKWYSNCDNDIFGESKLDYYLEKDSDLIIITKSQKDRLLLDYKYGYNAVSPQNEGVDFGNIIPIIKKFDRQIILFDNDRTGQKYASHFSEKYNIPWINLEIAKDIYEADQICGYQKLKHHLKWKMKLKN